MHAHSKIDDLEEIEEKENEQIVTKEDEQMEWNVAVQNQRTDPASLERQDHGQDAEIRTENTLLLATHSRRSDDAPESSNTVSHSCVPQRKSLPHKE